MRPHRNKWPDTEESRFTRLFAQIMLELTSNNTFESYRAYSLDSIARLQETREIIIDIKLGRLPLPAMEPVIKELLWSLQRDPIAKEIAEYEIAALKKLPTNTLKFLDSTEASVFLLYKMLSLNYRTHIEYAILECNAEKKVRLRILCGFYCSFLINLGYSKLHIHNAVYEKFFRYDLTKTGRPMIRSFMSNFQGQNVRFETYARLNSDFGKYLEKFGAYSRPASAFSRSIQSNVSANASPSFNYIIQLECKSLDEHGATSELERYLISHRAITLLDPSGIACEWDDFAYVIKKRASAGKNVHFFNKMFFAAPDSGKISGKRLRGARQYARRIHEIFDPPSTERLLSSINMAALSYAGGSLENRLISCWAAFEILLSDPPQDVPRIVHYSSLLPDVIVLRHVRRLFVAIFEEMIVSYRRKFTTLLSSVAPEFDNEHTKFAALLLLDENHGLRDAPCDLCSENPLALHRLWKIRNDFKTAEQTLKTLSEHRMRVEWQIHRIYRARNNLVHAGRVPSYLESLSINVFEYYRAAVSTVINMAHREEKKSRIDQTVLEICIENQIYLEKIRQIGSRNYTKDDLLLIVRDTGAPR